MTTARYILTILIVTVAAAATVALAWALAGIGVPIWQVAIGPVLLLAFLAVRLRRPRP